MDKRYFTVPIFILCLVLVVFNHKYGWVLTGMPKMHFTKDNHKDALNFDKEPIGKYLKVLEAIDNSKRVLIDGKYRIPNIVHQIYFGATQKFLLVHALSVVSVCRLQKPDMLYFHTDKEPIGNVWWDWVKKNVTKCGLTVNVMTPPQKVFGKTIAYVEHKSDIVRMQQLLEKGGIYVDFDVLFLRSFDPLRHYPCVLDEGKQGYLANGVLLAEPGSFFLRLWYSRYREYVKSYNYFSNAVPWQMLQDFPEYLDRYVHVENGTLLGNKWLDFRLQQIGHWDSLTPNSYSVHIQNVRNFRTTAIHAQIPNDLKSLRTQDNLVGEVMRYIYYGNKTLLPPGDNSKCDLVPC